MSEERRVRILTALGQRTHDGNTNLCTLASDVIAVTGAGISVVSARAGRLTTMCCSDKVAALVEELQLMVGEGPCLDAMTERRPVSESDLRVGGLARWPGFTPAAAGAGVAAVMGYPLSVGDVQVGALNLYQDRPGALSAEQHADALVTADVVAAEILCRHAEEPNGPIDPNLLGEPGVGLVVHQASGMVAVQLGVTVDEALTRIRADAFARGVGLIDVAADIVARRIRFD
jgi:hypothetical protein